MPINRSQLLGIEFPPVKHSYTRRDAQLYALAVNYGSEPLDPADLAFVYETNLVIAPTFPLVLGVTSLRDLGLGIRYSSVVHADQRLELYRRFAPDGTVVCKTRISNVWDRGQNKGAMLEFERDIFDESGTLLARCTQGALCRADGGFGGPAQPARPRMQIERSPDVTCSIPLLAQQALLYRLCGDRNALHVDPKAAKAAGFARPILHGLATYAVVARKLMRSFASSDPSRIASLYGRFSSPVFPGADLQLQAWDGGGTVAFKVMQDSRLVLDAGLLVLAVEPFQ